MPVTSSGLYVPDGGEVGEAYQWSESLPNPGNGNNLVYKITGNYYAELVNYTAVFATDATVIARAVNLDLQDADGKVIAVYPSAGTQGASQAFSYNYSGASGTGAIDSVGMVISGPVPRILLLPGWTISMVVTNGQAGDRFVQARVTLNRIPTGTANAAPPELVPAPIAL